MMRLEVQTIYPLVVSLYLFNTSIFAIDLLKSFIQDILNYTRLRVHSFVAPISAPFQISKYKLSDLAWSRTRCCWSSNYRCYLRFTSMIFNFETRGIRIS